MQKISIIFISFASMVLLLSYSTFYQKDDAMYTDTVWLSILNQSLPQDSLAEDRAKFVAEVMASIKGKEKLPADSVFKNIKIEMFKKMPAQRLLVVMQMGYSRSLGVSCNHCHNTTKWESEEKPAKQIARDMSAMSNKINGELLKGISGLQSTTPVVNCTTCHRGEIKPATNLTK